MMLMYRDIMVRGCYVLLRHYGTLVQWYLDIIVPGFPFTFTGSQVRCSCLAP